MVDAQGEPGEVDRGTVVQGQELRAGDQVSDALLKSGQLDLHPMSAQDAAKAVADGSSYFSITLPEDFSEAIASGCRCRASTWRARRSGCDQSSESWNVTSSPRACASAWLRTR